MASSSMNKNVKEEVAGVPEMVRSFLAADRDQLDLAQLLGATGLNSRSCGGTIDEEYPDLRLPQLTQVRHKTLPPELVEQFAHMQSNCLMGIFPEIGRAWLTVDSDIFVWRYADGEDLAYFDGLSETILSAALVKPKPDIFKDQIKFLLVLTTHLEVVILGVSFAGEDPNGEMQLLPDPLFTIATENIDLLCTVGTEAGRIFIGGKDGCLYEISYQPSGGWFGRKCSKINHSRSKLSFLLPNRVNNWLNDDDPISQIVVDDTRNVIFTRSEKGNIVGYDLGADGSGMTCFAQISMDSVKRKAAAIAATVAQTHFSQIVHIAAVTRRESKNLQLVAVTQSGVRLYFMTTTPSVLSPTASPTPQFSSPVSPELLDSYSRRPCHLELVHVRMPPGFTQNNSTAPVNVHKAHHNAGTLLMAASYQNDDVVWCVGKNHFTSEKCLSETQVSLPFDGRTWVITEVPEPSSPLSVACLPIGMSDIPPDPPIHVIQHFQRPPEYVVVSAQGCYMFNKMRPVDQLRHLLESRQDPDSEAVAHFFKLHKNGEASAACVILAMSALVGDGALANLSVAAFFRHGEEAFYKFPESQQAASTLGQVPGGTPYGHAAMSPIHGQKVQDLTAQSPGRYRPAVLELCYSDTMKGLFKMFARVVRPIWEGRLIEECVVTEGNVQHTLYTNRTEPDILSHILRDLNSLKTFIEAHCIPRLYAAGRNPVLTMPRFDSGYHGGSARQNLQRTTQAQATQAESKLIRSLYALANHTSQVLGLWRFICDHEVHAICRSLTQDTLTSLKSMTFQDFALDGQKITAEMISIVVNKYIDDNAEVDALNCRLRELCPSLYSLDDVMISRAYELLNNAKRCGGHQQDLKLAECLSLFQKVGRCVNLAAVSQQFQTIGYYEGVVELCAAAAEKRDERNLALHYYKTASDSDDNADGKNAYEARALCYKTVTDMMDELMFASENVRQTPGVPAELGPPSLDNQKTSKGTQNLQPDEAQRFAERCMQLLMQSDDELLHVTIYDWMLRKKLADRLLRITSPYLEQYLKRVTASHPDDQTYCDILWQYHERAGDHAAAAKILARLADSAGANRDLSQRIEYLSRAKMNGKGAGSVTAADTSGQLLHELEEKLEVAQLQRQILQTLEEGGHKAAVRELNSELMDITKLYSAYAEPFELAECKLAIVHCAGHYDPSLIDALWQNILDQEIIKLQKQSRENQIAMLSSKVSQLGRKYSNSSRYFPVEFLVDYLERLSCQNNWPEDWVFVSVLAADVELGHLLELYSDIHRQKLPHWNECGKPFHILRVIHRILTAFVDNPPQYVAPPKRRHFISNALDVIAVALVELQSTVPPSERLVETRTRYKTLQAKLQRLEDEVARRF